MPEKTKREDPLGFFNIHSVAKLEIIEKIFKVAQCRKNTVELLVELFWSVQVVLKKH